MGSGTRYRIGIAGLGLGTKFMMPYLFGHPRLHVVAAADPRREARERFLQETDAEVFPSAEGMITSGRLDVVYIATPNFLHEEQIRLAAQCGVHIIVEKPLAISMDECRRLTRAVRRSGVALVCGHSHCFDPPIVLMSRIARSGELGSVVGVVSLNYTDYLYRPRSQWELDSARGGGVLFNQAPHQVDIVRSMLPQDVTSVFGIASSADPDRATEGGYQAVLRDGSGASATIVYSGYGYFDATELTGGYDERGRLRDPATHGQTWARYLSRQHDGGDEEQLRDDRRFGSQEDRDGLSGIPMQSRPFFGMTVVSCTAGELRQTPEGVQVIGRAGTELRTTEGLPSAGDAVVDELVAAIEGREPEDRIRHDETWGSATLEACLAIQRSSRIHDVVHLGQWGTRLTDRVRASVRSARGSWLRF